MKKLLLFFLFLVISLAARSQAIQFTASVPHTNGTPSGTPSNQGSRLRYDKTNQILYQWTGSAWTRVIGVITDGDKGDLTVSSSGTNWQLDAGSVGNTEIASGAGGVYKGNGTIPGITFAEITEEFSIGNAGTSHFSVIESGAYLYSPFGTATKEAGCANDGAFLAQGDVGKINVGDDGMKVTDYRATPRGLQYVSDYSATYNDRSLPDVAHVKALISDSIATVGGGGGGSSYLVYTALLSQSGTSAPTATVLENTLGGSITWTRTTTGVYTGTLAGAFLVNKTWGVANLDGESEIDLEHYARFGRVSSDAIRVRTFRSSGVAQDEFEFLCLEIRVYP